MKFNETYRFFPLNGCETAYPSPVDACHNEHRVKLTRPLLGYRDTFQLLNYSDGSGVSVPTTMAAVGDEFDLV